MKVKNLVSNPVSVFHPESYRLTGFMSPHAAAFIDMIEIDLKEIKLPETGNTLVIEGAGGLMVPLNNDLMVIDLIEHLNAEVVLVSQNYLGSINHTILSAEALMNRKMNILGVVFNGETNETTEEAILNKTGLKCIGRVFQENKIDKEIVHKYAWKLRKNGFPEPV